MYGGGNTTSYDCARIRIPAGSREGNEEVKVQDLFD